VFLINTPHTAAAADTCRIPRYRTGFFQKNPRATPLRSVSLHPLRHVRGAGAAATGSRVEQNLVVVQGMVFASCVIRISPGIAGGTIVAGFLRRNGRPAARIGRTVPSRWCGSPARPSISWVRGALLGVWASEATRLTARRGRAFWYGSHPWCRRDGPAIVASSVVTRHAEARPLEAQVGVGRPAWPGGRTRAPWRG
jgi:hypothetical protein